MKARYALAYAKSCRHLTAVQLDVSTRELIAAAGTARRALARIMIEAKPSSIAIDPEMPKTSVEIAHSRLARALYPFTEHGIPDDETPPSERCAMALLDVIVQLEDLDAVQSYDAMRAQSRMIISQCAAVLLNCGSEQLTRRIKPPMRYEP
ncbi:MAG: hypothetical protein GY715_05835 [Planctomycetes bacterium]|nr:hypothetical protein [Planctomycetota bacterium]